jgi:hypothetical protein
MTEEEVMQQAAAVHARISRDMEELRNKLLTAEAQLAAKNELVEEVKRVSVAMLDELKVKFEEENNRVRLMLIDEQIKTEHLRHDLDQARADVADLSALFGTIRHGVEQFEMRPSIKRRNGGHRKRLAVVADDGAGGKQLPDKDPGEGDISDVPHFLARKE